jgi:hypothetical protein
MHEKHMIKSASTNGLTDDEHTKFKKFRRLGSGEFSLFSRLRIAGRRLSMYYI